MEPERRGAAPDRRKPTDRRARPRDRRRGSPPVLADRRTRFSVVYFVIAFLILIVLNSVLGRANTRQVPYSELKQRIQAGELKHVVLAPNTIRGVVRDSLQAKVGAEILTAVRVPEDEALIPLLDSKRVGTTYEGTA